ncbi:MAG: hypothetical protein V4692_14350 [Bdellovibrionota bacterium]
MSQIWISVSKICFGVLVLASASSSVAAEKLTFIVNHENPVTSLTINEVRDYYFKKNRTWPDGTSVRFIDADETTGAKKAFLSDYLERSSKDVNLYWIGQKLYSGNSAPLQESSESMIVQFVGSLKGAIGYVTDPALATAKDVKIIKVEISGK